MQHGALGPIMTAVKYLARSCSGDKNEFIADGDVCASLRARKIPTDTREEARAERRRITNDETR